jgi:hypothetical protein
MAASVHYHETQASERLSALILPRILLILISKLTFYPSARPKDQSVRPR